MSDLELLLRQIADPAAVAWNDETYDLAVARGLVGADRAVAIAHLIDRARQGDERAILTLGHLEAREALPVLRAAARGTDPWAASARRAMVLVGEGGEVVAQLAEDAVHGPSKMARVAAVTLLAKVGGAAAVAALEQALADPEYEVRVLAWDGVVAAFGLAPTMRDPEGRRTKTTRLELIRDLLACELSALVQIGVAELRAITGELARGRAAAALGLTWQPDPDPAVRPAITRAMLDRDAAYPLAAIASLTGLPRRWAEAAIAMSLDRDPPDPRAPAALAELAATWTAPVLAEVARAAAVPAELGAAIAAALAALGSR